MREIKSRKLQLMIDLFIEVLHNYIDKFTVYNIPTSLQLIYYNQQLKIPTINHYIVFQNIIDELSLVGRILALRDLSHLQICDNLPQLLMKLVSSSERDFLKERDNILSACYKSSISYEEYTKVVNSDNDHEVNILEDEEFLEFHRERMERLKVNDRRIFG